MKTYYHSPLGWIRVAYKGAELFKLDFVPRRPSVSGLLDKGSLLFRQLDGYFHHKKKNFTFTKANQGTIFQNRVWRALKTIPYGKTVSYGQVASRIGKKKSVRAVARAIGQNKIPIIIPCHRVIGSDGSLTGYAYGLRKKAWLLKHESD